MALTWDVGKIHDYQNVTTQVLTEDQPDLGLKAGDKMWHPVTTALIWHSLGTNIGEITEKNADEVYARIAFIEKLHGTMLVKDGQPRYITPEEVHAHIGLETNVFPFEKRAQFLARQAGKHYLDDCKRAYTKAVAVLEEKKEAAAA